jgi:hypothetical protein
MSRHPFNICAQREIAALSVVVSALLRVARSLLGRSESTGELEFHAATLARADEMIE